MNQKVIEDAGSSAFAEEEEWGEIEEVEDSGATRLVRFAACFSASNLATLARFAGSRTGAKGAGGYSPQT